MADLVVIGSSNMDLVISVPRIPVVGETVLGTKSSMVYGGKGANQAVAAIRAGGHVAFITKLGADVFGQDMKAHFIKEGFSPEYILTDAHEPSGVAQILVSDKGENSIAVAPGANMSLLPSDIEPFKDLISEAKIVLLQLEIPLETVEYIADIAYDKGVKVILNPAPAQKLSSDLLKKIWLLTPNETEAQLISGLKVTDEESAKLAAICLAQKGVQNVLITLGGKGCILYSSNAIQHFEAFEVKAVDTTAAGDVFNGAMSVALTQNKTFEEAIQFGSAAAAISVTRKGAQTSIPSLGELLDFIGIFSTE